MTRAVLFDLDDTIFDHRETSRRALSALRARFPALRQFPLDELERRHAHVLEELHHGGVMQGAVSVDEAREERFRRLWRQAGAAADGDVAREAAALYRRTYLAERCLVPGAADLLRAIKPFAPIGIVTNNVRAEQEDKLRQFGLRTLVDELVVSADEGVSKPDPVIFLRALARLGCEASEAVMVGDTWATDIVGAAAAGIRAIWFNRCGLPRPDPGLAEEIQSLEPAGPITRAILEGV